jgi:hypothetical protein
MKPTQNNNNMNRFNSNNSSNITLDNSNLYLKNIKNKYKSIYSNNQSNAYLNSSIFESRFSTNPNDNLINSTTNNNLNNNNNNNSSISMFNNNNSNITNNNNIYLTETKQIKTEITDNNNNNNNNTNNNNINNENPKPTFDTTYTSSSQTFRRIDQDPSKIEIFYPELKDKKSIPSLHRLHPENHNIISCCNNKINARNLNKFFTNFYLIPPKSPNKFIINHKIDNIHVPDSTFDYIEKTKKIILLNYRLNLKKEAKKNIENKINEQIKEIDFKMKEINKLKNELENNFFIKYYTHLKQLQMNLDNEKIINVNLQIKLSKLNKEVNSLEGNIQKKKNYLNNIEKWLKFLFLLKTKKNFDNVKKALKENLNENGKIFNNVDEFDEIFTNEENKNIYLLKRYEQKRLEVENLKDERDLYEKTENKISTNLDNEILEKEKLQTLLRLRYESLKKLKGKILSINNTTPLIPKTKNKKTLPNNNNNSSNNNNNNKKLYLKIAHIYINIYNNCYKENIFIYNLKQIVNRNEKMIKMMICIELMCNFLIGKFNEYKNEKKFNKILIEIQSKIDFEHKRQKTIEKKQEEYKKYLELKSQIDKRNEKVYFIPKKKVDNYPFNLYVKPKTDKMVNKNVKKELTIEDFLYDLEEE